MFIGFTVDGTPMSTAGRKIIIFPSSDAAVEAGADRVERAVFRPKRCLGFIRQLDGPIENDRGEVILFPTEASARLAGAIFTKVVRC